MFIVDLSTQEAIQSAYETLGPLGARVELQRRVKGLNPDSAQKCITEILKWGELPTPMDSGSQTVSNLSPDQRE